MIDPCPECGVKPVVEEPNPTLVLWRIPGCCNLPAVTDVWLVGVLMKWAKTVKEWRESHELKL